MDPNTCKHDLVESRVVFFDHEKIVVLYWCKACVAHERYMMKRVVFSTRGAFLEPGWDGARLVCPLGLSISKGGWHRVKQPPRGITPGLIQRRSPGRRLGMGKKLPRVKWNIPLRRAFGGGHFMNTGEFMGVRFKIHVSSYSGAGCHIHVEYLSGPKESQICTAEGANGGVRYATGTFVGETLKAEVYMQVTGRHPMDDGYTE
jgi:hypothetical protein